MAVGAEVYCAGNLIIDASREVKLNCDSGHYMAEEPFVEDDEIRLWAQAMRATLADADLTAIGLHPGIADIYG